MAELTVEEMLQAINEAKNKNNVSSNTANNTTNNKKDFSKIEDTSLTSDILRAGGQGLSFGFGDEIEGFVRSIANKDISYEDAVSQARGKLDRFREENPVLAYGSEIAGSLPSAVAGGVGLARLGVKGAMKIGGIQGAGYGVGAGEDVEGRVIGGATGGVLGGAISGVAQKVLPKTTELAKKMMNKGIRLTPGQSFGGAKNITGDFIQGLEDSSTSIIGVGSPLQNAKITALSDFNRTAIKEALEPITGKITVKEFNKVIPKNLHGNELFKVADDFLKSKYDDTLSNVNLDETGINFLKNTYLKTINNFKTPQVNKDKIIIEVLDLINSATDKGKISGIAIKGLERDIGALAKSYSTSKGSEIFLTRLLNALKTDTGKVVRGFNPSSNLQQLNLANVGMNTIGKAVLKGNKTEGIFSVNQFLDAIKQNDPSINKILTKTGKNFLQDLGTDAQKVLGGYTPDSGTASRLVSSNVASDPASIIRFLPASIASNLIYGGMGRPVTRGLLQAPNQALRNTPAVSGLLSTNVSNRGQQQWQYQIIKPQHHKIQLSMV